MRSEVVSREVNGNQGESTTMRVSEPKPHEPIRLVQNKSGHVYRVTLDVSAKGEKRRQVTTTWPTLAAARSHVIDTRASLAKGSYTAPNGETLRQLADRWLASRVDIREVSRDGYRQVLTRTLTRIGDRPVQTIRTADVAEHLGWLSREGSKSGGPLKPRSVQMVRAVLVQVFDLAVAETTIPSNPARAARRPRARIAKGRDLEHWTAAQLRAFVTAADADPWAAAWRLSASGLTRADVLGLRWSDVDLAAGAVSVSQGRTALSDGTSVVEDPKSEQRRRRIEFEVCWPGTVDRLRQLRKAQAADRLAAGPAWSDSGYVVVDSLGQPVAPQVYSDRFRRITTAAGLPPIVLHSLRHSIAFLLHDAGVSPADAAAFLGHTVEVYLSTYLPHSGSSGISAAAKALGRAVG